MCLLKPTKEITHDPATGAMKIRTLTTFKNFDMDFTIGEEFTEDLGPVDGRTCQVCVYVCTEWARWLVWACVQAWCYSEYAVLSLVIQLSTVCLIWSVWGKSTHLLLWLCVVTTPCCLNPGFSLQWVCVCMFVRLSHTHTQRERNE